MKAQKMENTLFYSSTELSNEEKASVDKKITGSVGEQ